MIVGDQGVLDHGHLILQQQLALFQPRDLHLVGRSGIGQRGDCSIEIAVFGAQHRQTLSQFLFVHRHSSQIASSRRYPESSLWQTPGVGRSGLIWFYDNHAARRETAESLHGSHPQKETEMVSSHVSALQTKHAGIEARLRDEMNRPAPDAAMIQSLKREKLRLKEEISGR